MSNKNQKLIESALAARLLAYAPYSGFLVGAAIQAGPDIVAGCNVENVSYGLTICAERVAVANAIARGQQKFEAIAIASHGGVAPCGACRQVLMEFAPQMTIYLIDVANDDEVRQFSLDDLLPNAIQADDLPR